MTAWQAEHALPKLLKQYLPPLPLSCSSGNEKPPELNTAAAAAAAPCGASGGVTAASDLTAREEPEQFTDAVAVVDPPRGGLHPTVGMRSAH